MSTWPPPSHVDDDSKAHGSNLLPRGYYQPGPTVVLASALRWVPYDTVVSAVRRLMGASHKDLRHGLQQLSRSLGSVFFLDGAEMQHLTMPFAARRRFPEDSLFVCADRWPLADALKTVNRVMTEVGVTKASKDACDGFYDALDELMDLLVYNGWIGNAVLNQAAFESDFALKWVPEE